ncbi:malectin domain-containing carbohydrate-binding protein [Salinigranum salinum]|uniref:malectin domain-containing carbohydrate-binding protein n=1 Tax=Salinigranum salinum TaxID=1364937 RepID=UPI00186464B9|nr:malectin domain-containing carbohydrate-binding protein [Salinigranum salinum]
MTVGVGLSSAQTDESPVVFAVNAGGPAYTASDGTVYQADTNFDGGASFQTGSAGTPSDPEIESTTDDLLYQSERYGTSFGYDVSVPDGTYEVTVQFAEIYQGVSSNDVPDSSGPTDGTNENDRVFDASIEGTTVLDGYDIFAEVGPLTATQKTYTVEVTDGTLNLDFDAVNNNAKISAIKVSSAQTDESPVVFAVNTGGPAYASSDGTVYQADTNFDGGTVFRTGSAGTPSDPEIESTTDDLLYQSERYGTSFGYDVSVPDGTYEVTVQFAEIYQDVSSNDVPDSSGPTDGTNENDRVFDVSIEGTTVLDGYDIFAEVGPLTATQKTYTVEVTDGTLNLDFDAVNNNAKISAIKVTTVDGDPVGDSPTSDAIYRVNAGGSQLSAADGGGDWLADTASDPAADTNAGAANSKAYSTSDDIPTTGSVPATTPSEVFETERYDPGSGDEMSWNIPDVTGGETYEVRLYFAEIYHTSDGQRVFDVSIEGTTVLDDYDIHADVGHDTGTVKTFTVESSAELDIDFTRETGNPKVAAIEVVPVDGTGNTAPTIDAIADRTVVEGDSIDVSVSASDADGDSLSLSLGQAPGFVSLTDDGDGTGTVSVDTAAGDAGTYTVDVVADDGTATTTESFTVTVDDGTNTAPTIDAISDRTVAEGDSIDVSVSASDADGDGLSLSLGQAPGFVSLTDDGDGTGTATIEPQTGDAGTYTVDVVADDGTDTTTESFTVTVESDSTSGEVTIAVNENGGIDTSTYRTGSFEISNTGDEPIESITIDLRSSILPDLVFDPEGTAGDDAAKGFVLDEDNTGGTVQSSFSNPHNGVDGSDGYDTLTITFGSFQPGESIAFSADNDPTSIKGAGSGQQTEAGPVSGLELTGSTVTTEFGDGATVETSLFSDGSNGGSQAVGDGEVAAAPTIGVDGVSLSSTTLSSDHTAATVTDASQTVTVTGEPGSTVTLLRVEAELNLEDVPTYDGTPGYEIEEYEGNTAIQVEEYTVTIGSDGTASVPVTLTDSTSVGGYNYFIAVTDDGEGETGTTSNTVVLKYE